MIFFDSLTRTITNPIQHTLKKTLIFIASGLFLAHAAEDEITNAFDDLKRTGTVAEKDSVMRIRASEQELDALLKEKPAENYFCFTEDRDHDIRLKNAIPRRWVERKPAERKSFKGQCRPGEFFTWQIGVFAPYSELDNLSLSFSALKNGQGNVIPSSKVTCINTEGVDACGKPFKRNLTVNKGNTQALWIGVDVPQDAAGTYTGTATVKASGGSPCEIAFSIDVKGEAILNHGDDEGWRKTRLRWLNSTIAQSGEPTKPYIPLSRKDRVIHYLGGSLELTPEGYPAQITTRYDANNKLSENARNQILTAPVKLVIETGNGIETLKPESFKFTKEEPGVIEWEGTAANDGFQVSCAGHFEFDGSLSYDFTVKNLKEADIKDIRLEVPYSKIASTYMMGLGRKGGFRPQDAVEWKWDTKKHQDKVWVGGINAGMNLVFKDENYKRPLVNVYYALGKLNLPESWGNEGKGGITIKNTQENGALLTAFSGERKAEKGKELHFMVDALVTPVKPINLEMQATDRFYHSNSDVSGSYIGEASKAGANFINIHHKKDIYPFINYPYYDEAIADFKAFVDEAHKKNIGTRVYYTTRELTVKIPEIWALRSLGGEVIHDGPGKDTRTLIHRNGPNPWLNENLESNFIPAWYNAFGSGKYKGEMDISVITTPDSRWNNYYLEGLDWMVKKLGIEGVYIDDSALDRRTLQRARRILDEDGKHRLIDIHSWNHMNNWAGFANSLGIYLELLPYVDKLWIGESFGAGSSPDFWLVEMSGIPFGMMSETLDAKNIYRGMVYGMLPRLPWSGNPVPMWKLWDNFGMKNARMSGYWDEENPVKTGNEHVYATVYTNGNKALIAVANWTKDEQKANFTIDSKLLGFNPSKIYLPEIEKTQESGDFKLEQEIAIPGNKGLFIVVEK